jgi:hypothetical protein
MNLNGKSNDLILESMKKHGIPINFENYMGLAYPEGIPDNFGHEDHMNLPEEIRKMVDNEGS